MQISRLFPSVLLPVTLLCAAQASSAQDTARVISSTPILQRVEVPQQVCSDQQVAVPAQKSGAGAILGALAGGAIGNSLGGGNGRAAATAAGILGGAVVGNNIEGGSQPSVQTVRQCQTQQVLQDRVVGYNVLYEYAGKQYSVRSQQDPGPYLQVQVVPVLPGQSVAPQARPMQRY